jgi:hypothetical protein
MTRTNIDALVRDWQRRQAEEREARRLNLVVFSGKLLPSVERRQRQAYIDALQHELPGARARGDGQAVLEELKRLAAKPAPPPPARGPASTEREGEFYSPAHRADYIEALKKELRGGVTDAAAVQAELTRLSGPPAKTQIELQMSAQELEELEERELNAAADAELSERVRRRIVA